MIPGDLHAAYAFLLVAAMALGLYSWLNSSRKDPRSAGLFVVALAGAFVGAKVVYLFSEGWLSWNKPDVWRQWATGKSVLGALLFGFLSVEGIKRLAGIRTVTGDWFASFVPLSLALGRLGCLCQGCCQGRSFSGWIWPAVQVELAFNLLCFGLFFWMRKKHILEGQHFHLFMIAYGLFRFLHEPLRATPKVLWLFSGYQLFAIVLAGVGFVAFSRRSKSALQFREEL